MNATGVSILQYAPESYDFERFVTSQGLCDFWELTRAASSMRVGDRVYIVRLKGAEAAGIIAIGQLVSRVYTHTESSKRVDVLFEARVDPVLTREEMRRDSILKDNFGLCHGIAGSDFQIHSQETADRLEELTTPRLQPFAPPGAPPPVSPDVPLDDRTRLRIPVVMRLGQPEFRRRLLMAYGARCAVTGCDAVEALEAAHISPYRGAHTNSVMNGLLLRADIHALFDQGLLAVDTSSMTLVLAPELAETTYAELVGQPLRLPRDPQCHPSHQALDEHRRNTGWWVEP